MHKLKASTYLRNEGYEGYKNRRLSAITGSLMTGNSTLGTELLTGTNPNSSQVKSKTDTFTRFESSNDLGVYVNDFDGLLGLMWTPLSWFYFAAPVSIYAYLMGLTGGWLFWPTFLTMIPLASLLGNVTEELSNHTGELIGGLINATLGNIIEMILTVQSLRFGLVDVVQGTLIGSIYSNLLLVLGCSLFAGGTKYHIQRFSVAGAQASTSLLLISCLGFITPTLLKIDGKSDVDVLAVSRIIAIIIGSTYILFLYFQLISHISLFQADPTSPGDGSRNLMLEDSGDDGIDADEDDSPISKNFCIYSLAVITVIVALFSQLLVSSIETVSQEMGIPTPFIGVILLPIVGNAAEHLTAVSVAMKNKVDLTMGVAVGSSTQIAMFMVPFAVLCGWIMGVPMTLAISASSCVMLAFSILIVMSVVQDGESNWLEGVMLVVAYLIVCVLYWNDSI